MRLAWLTDIHLNFLDADQQDRFAREVGRTGADAVLISGDITEAPPLESQLERLARLSDIPILYVLGNHDFYRGRVEPVRAACRELDSDSLTYLHGRGPHGLTDRICVVGVDGWADGGYGRPRDSDLIFTDWHLIEDFREVDAVMDVDARLEMVTRFAVDSAQELRRALTEAVKDFERVLVLTHVPPFPRAAGHDGSAMADLWVPWLACRATGDVLLEVAQRHPTIEFEVLCGHTHVARVSSDHPNLTTRTGSATYREPEIQRVWELDDERPL